MLKRALLTLIYGLALLLAVTASFLPLLALHPRLDEPTFLATVSLWLGLVSLLLIPLFGMLLRKVWFFRGSGEPISLEQLRTRLLTINLIDCPVAAIAKRKTLVFTWRYRDTRWCELLNRLGMSSLYELHCRFDVDTRTVLLADRVRSMDVLICPDQVKTGWPRIPLPLLRVRHKQLNLVEHYAALAEYDYAIHPREIKAPVLGTILASGWHVRFTLL